jgi:hypothetical protein
LLSAICVRLCPMAGRIQQLLVSFRHGSRGSEARELKPEI